MGGITDGTAVTTSITASNIYRAFISGLQAQSGNHVDAVAAAIMIADAQYLIAHCP